MSNFSFDAATKEKFDLQRYEHVNAWARTIYSHVASQSMPIRPPHFSAEAVEALRRWYNIGCPKTTADISVNDLPEVPIPKEPAEKPLRVRKDINTLNWYELTQYRVALLKLMEIEKLDSKWQTGGFLHANWCLHYMQASFPWHRAHLLWLENEIGFPIPYWNFFSEKASTATHRDSGIPNYFLEDEFTDFDGVKQTNPLKHALARAGVSRASTTQNSATEVTRAEELTFLLQSITAYQLQVKDQKLASVARMQGEIYAAIQNTSIGSPEGAGDAFTFATVDLSDNNDVNFYKDHLNEFDGVLEQAHDNFHGWTGPDMANNSYAAFDPLFWSFHANFDRIFENWIRENDESVQWSSNFPYIKVDENNSHPYKFTTIGDMVKDSKALGYTYLPPGNPDYNPKATSLESQAPIVLFTGVRCTDKTHIIHVAVAKDDKDDQMSMSDIGGPGYIESVTRLGMGPNNGNNRCITGSVVRRLEAGHVVEEMGLKVGEKIPLKQLVLGQDGLNQVEVPKEIWSSKGPGWEGFVGQAVWAKPVGGIVPH